MVRRKRKRSFVRGIFHAVAVIAMGFFAISILWVVITKWVPVYWTPLMSIRRCEACKERKVNPKLKEYTVSHQWVSYEDISPQLVRAVIASEDNLFAKHHGFSKRGIEQAFKERREKGVVKHGGSTISQQTAKNVFLWPSRSYVRKAFECYYTELIELIWGKRRIMEVYLNVIEMGDGVYGAEAASRIYFSHSAQRLTAGESALIAVCLPSPRKMHPNKPSNYVLKRQQQILSLMPKMGKIEL